ncbi:hypothetical protein [Streptacidiphilus anmyonensis]|uniref:hypothetical protein n=1 Tax=Streptacidiphilus anmyonensis TaxID=405782 RepID=UPI0005A8C86B|nr:hypothetical protein [Streptacidiphilus anmyonensis]
MSPTRSEASPTGEAAPGVALGDAGAGAAVADPFATLDEALAGLCSALASDEWLDAFLWAAGASQIVEDRIDAVAWPPRRLLVHLARHGGDGPAMPPALRAARGPALRLASRALDAAGAGYRAAPPTRALRAWASEATRLTLALAGLVMGADLGAVAAGRVLAGPGFATRLVGRDLLRPPACFRSFDQHPADAAELARRYAARYPAREPPLLVLGVRTSGSYLAPLLAAALRGLGYRRVAVATTRPGVPPPPGAASAARVLLTDDPPVTGGALAEVAAALERRGVPAAAIVPVFACFEDPPVVPERLARHDCVTLLGTAWHVPSLLAPRALAELLPRLLDGVRVLDVRAAEPGPVARTGHLGVPVTAVVEHPEDGTREELALYAEWTGVGRFGRLAPQSAAALDGLVPRVRGFADGVLLRDRGRPPDGPPRCDPQPVPPREVAVYLAERERRLPLHEDRSGRLGGRDPVWESAARTLAPVLGRAAVLLRPALVQPLTRHLLASASRPCLVDGRTAPEHWAGDGDRGHRKLDWAEGGFASLDLACYDAVYDLAGAVAHGPADDEAEQELLRHWTELTGRGVDPARWFLFQLVQARNAVRLAGGAGARSGTGDGAGDGPDLRARARRAQARAAQRFLAGALLADLDEREPAAEPRGWCVLDVDGVLETDVLGFPAASPLGVTALRALRAHGYRPLLATGRSLAEVRDRCAAYGLAGGVGEYGAACVDAGSGRVRVVLDDARRGEGDGGLALLLASLPGHETDPLSHWCVRASLRHADGRRTGLPERETADLLRDGRFGRLFDAVPGDAQTDFVPHGADKAEGVRALLALMGEPVEPPVLAVGDGPADLPLLRWSRNGVVPSHARELAEGHIHVAPGAYQAGLADAVAALLGHRPGHCPICRPPALTHETRAVLAVLALPEAGRRGAVIRLARLALANADLTAAHSMAVHGVAVHGMSGHGISVHGRAGHGVRTHGMAVHGGAVHGVAAGGRAGVRPDER